MMQGTYPKGKGEGIPTLLGSVACTEKEEKQKRTI